MAKPTTQEITQFTAGRLITTAAQLKVTLEVDAALLQQEVAQFTDGFSTVQLAIKTLEVTDEESYQQCIDLRNDAGRREKGLTEIWSRYKTPLNAARTVVLDYEHATVDVCKAAKDDATRKAERYLMEQQRAKREAEQALARVADQQRRDLEAEARRLATRGEIDKAEQVQRQAQMSVAPSLPDAIPQAVGAKVGAKFTARVMDVVAFAKAVVDGKVDLMQEVKPGDIRPILVIDQVVLNAVAARQMTGLNWPGVTVEEGVRISSTGRG